MCPTVLPTATPAAVDAIYIISAVLNTCGFLRRCTWPKRPEPCCAGTFAAVAVGAGGGGGAVRVGTEAVDAGRWCCIGAAGRAAGRAVGRAAGRAVGRAPPR